MPKENLWKLLVAVNGYASMVGAELATQASEGRFFELIDSSYKNNFIGPGRIKIRLLEDGYTCWFDNEVIRDLSLPSSDFIQRFYVFEEVQHKIPKVINWIKKASIQKNKYLWGGTIGPDFDCSGLIQTAFASEGIWLPRDAYQQEIFCKLINASPSNYSNLLEGDLIFFGDGPKSTHVALYAENGCYWHSSGLLHGNNGIALNNLNSKNFNSVETHYRSQYRCAGRIMHSFNSAII
tara:strand:+ start:2021 stop:2731 length:711 start_codon:yes stop_codon:yes gene_type:complete